MKASKKDGGGANGGRQGQPQDLWPDLSNMAPIRTPFLVLKEQAALLGQKTHNIVTAQVQGPIRSSEGDDVCVYFNLVAPALENYQFRLFEIVYSIIKPYPVRIFTHGLSLTPHAVISEEDLIEELKAIFSNRATVSAISAMVAQSTAMEVGAS